MFGTHVGGSGHLINTGEVDIYLQEKTKTFYIKTFLIAKIKKYRDIFKIVLMFHHHDQ